MNRDEQLAQLESLYEQAEALREQLGLEYWPGERVYTSVGEDNAWIIAVDSDGFGACTVSETRFGPDANDEDEGELARDQMCATEAEGIELADRWTAAHD